MTAKQFLEEKVMDAWLVDEMSGILEEYDELKSKEFAEFMGDYIKCQGGWWHIHTPQTIANINTTSQLYQEFKKQDS